MGDLKPYFGVIDYLVVQDRSLLRSRVVASSTRLPVKITGSPTI